VRAQRLSNTKYLPIIKAKVRLIRTKKQRQENNSNFSFFKLSCSLYCAIYLTLKNLYIPFSLPLGTCSFHLTLNRHKQSLRQYI